LTGNYEAVSLTANGKYGNRFIELMSALAFCFIMKIKLIYAMRPFLSLRVNITTKYGYQIIPVDDLSQIRVPADRCVNGGAWWLPEV
jgi:hypothetical protein